MFIVSYSSYSSYDISDINGAAYSLDNKSTHRYNQFYEYFSIYTIFIIHRGFGFVTFEDPICIEKVLSEPSHELDGKRVKKKKRDHSSA